MLLVPFILAKYNVRSILLWKHWPFTDTNLIGRACSVLAVSMLCGKVVALLINGPLNSLCSGAETVMIVSCAAFFGVVLGYFVIIPNEDSEKNTKVADKDTTVAKATELLDCLLISFN